MKTTRTLIAFAALAALGSSAFAQATITQSKALAGNVTPGDAPGYPITLSVPGHYQLKGNLNVPAGVNGIEIIAANVTLDLNGFSLNGPVSCTRNASTRLVTCVGSGGAKRDGVKIVQPGAVLRNGTVQGFDGTGVSVSDGASARVEDLRSAQNFYNGIVALGANASILASRSSFELNGSSGVAVQYGGNFVDSSASFNNQVGFGGSCHTLIVNSVATGNLGSGVLGVSAKGVVSKRNGAPRSGGCTMGGNLDDSGPW